VTDKRYECRRKRDHDLPSASDPERFGPWVPGYFASAGLSPGYVTARGSVQASRQLDWTLEVCSDSQDFSGRWLDSPGRKAALSEPQARGHWRVVVYAVLLALFMLLA
jgi:uncharacterized protein